MQRDLKRARIVLLAAAGRSTRSIAQEVGVQPRIVSLWRHRYADHGRILAAVFCVVAKCA
jgi:transposase